MRRIVPLALALVLALLPGTAVPAAAAGPASTVAGGRSHPWGLALLPDGSALFTERGTRRVWLARVGFDAAGRLWASELGQDRWDEVKHVVPGGNDGWPLVEGRSAAPGSGLLRTSGRRRRPRRAA